MDIQTQDALNQREKYRRRQYMYTLRSLERRGKELEEQGYIPEEQDDEKPQCI